jgi:hypothetical protein
MSEKGKVIEFRRKTTVPGMPTDARVLAQCEALDRVKAQIMDGSYTGFLIILGKEDDKGECQRYHVMDSNLSPPTSLALTTVAQRMVLDANFTIRDAP